MATVPQTFKISATPTISTSPAYSSGDNVGGLMTLTNAQLVAAIAQGRVPYVVAVDVADKSTQAAPTDVFLYDTIPAGGGNDNAAFDPDDADLLLNSGGSVVHVTDWMTHNDNSKGRAANLAIPVIPADDTNFYARAVTRGTPTYASTSDLTFIFTIRLV